MAMVLLRTALRHIVLSVAFATTLAIPSASHAGVLVPAYFYPGTGGPGGVGDGWAAMASAAATIPVTAVLNPNSGPLPGPADQNYVNAMTNLEAAGGSVVAYIHTSYAGRLLATVEGEANTYITQYGSLIKGFFVDEMTNDNDAGHLAYYHSLYGFLKGLNPSYQVIGNPGTATDPGYLTPATQGADVLITHENNDQTDPYTSTSPAAWTLGYPRSDFASIIYNQPTAAGMTADVNYAAEHHAGTVYVTDRTLPNPYDQLPSYWDQEVAAIRSAAIPEPGAFTIAVVGGVTVTLGGLMRVRRRRVSVELRRAGRCDPGRAEPGIIGTGHEPTQTAENVP
jgi:hypothetical protein